MASPDYIGEWERHVEQQERAAVYACNQHRASMNLPEDGASDLTDCVDRTCAVGCPLEMEHPNG